MSQAPVSIYNHDNTPGVITHTAAKPWWGEKSGYGDGVQAHTADPTQYHYLDDRQSERVRSGHPLARGVVVPRSGIHGESLGFDCNKAAVVHVDPDAPDGGIVVDLSRVTPEQVERAARGANYPHEVYYHLGHHPTVKNGNAITLPSSQPEPARNNPLMPGQYVVPRSSADGTQVGPQSGDQSLALRHHVQVVPETQETPVANQPASAYRPPIAYPGLMPSASPQPQPQPQITQPAAPPIDLVQLAHIIFQMQQASQIQPAPVPLPVAATPTPPPVSSGPRPPQPSSPPQTVEDWKQASQLPKDGIIAGFDTLDIPFITGPIPKKPTLDVYFDFGNLGHIRSRYHELLETDNAVVLVFDTRYEESDHYLPPTNKEEPFKLNCPKKKKSYTVLSTGVQFAIGCIDLVVLALQQTSSVENEE